MDGVRQFTEMLYILNYYNNCSTVKREMATNARPPTLTTSSLKDSTFLMQPRFVLLCSIMLLLCMAITSNVLLHVCFIIGAVDKTKTKT